MNSGKVVVIDDNAAGLRSMKLLLEMAGYETAGHTSANSFLASGDTPSCLIVDQNMPGVTGLQLVASLRERPDHIPVLLICGFVDAPIATRAAELHVEKILEKPLEPEQLLAFVAAYAGSNAPV